MSKKTFAIIISILLLILLAVFFYLFFFGPKNALNETGGAIKNFFPFGSGGVTIKKPPVDDQGTQVPPPISGDQQTGTVIPRLRKVSNNPVVGYTITKKDVPVDPNTIKPKEIPITPTYKFEKDLKVGARGQEVKELEILLNMCPQTIVATKGVGSPGKEGILFGKTLEKAVIAFQEKFAEDILKPKNLEKGTGIVDEATRAKLNAPFSCTEILEAPKTIKKDVVRYVEKGSSNIFDAFADTLSTTRLSNTTIPRVHEALFGNNGKKVFMRYLKEDNQTIETFVGNVPEPIVGGDSLPQLTGSLMQENIADLSVSPDDSQIFYMLPSGNNMLGFTSDLDGKNQRRVFSSSFFGWLSQWPTPKTLLFTVKATAYGNGFAYGTDISKGGFVKILGGIAGLTTLMSPDGKYVLLSHNVNSSPALGVYSLETKKIRDLYLYSLPEKCVWSKNSLVIYCASPDGVPPGHLFPDDWYQGTFSFDDSFWVIDTTGTHSNQRLFGPVTEGGEVTDGVSLKVDDSKKYLYFINRRTGILWQYDLSPTPPEQPPQAAPSPTPTTP